MLVNPADPFPLLSGSQTLSYKEEQNYSSAVDDYLGLNVQQVEASIKARSRSDQQEWVHVDPQVFLTPYTEIRLILSQLNINPRHLIVDLGAGYGRMGFVLATHHPDAHFVGLELVPERVQEAARIFKKQNCLNAQIKCVDLTKVEPPIADIYFLYDFGHREAITKTLEDLKNISRTRQICVVARGGASRSLIQKQHFWLCDVIKPQHFNHYSIYSTG
jgi:predicted RNA methylase